MRPLASWSAFQISRQTVLNDPAGYARIVAVQWYGMWTWSWISTRPAAEKALAAVSEPDLSKFLAGKNKVKLSGLIIVPHSVFLFKMTISAMMLALSAILPFIAITRRFDNHVLTVAAAAGITIQAKAYSLVIALLQSAQDRYAFGLMPTNCLFLMPSLCEKRSKDLLALLTSWIAHT